MEFGFDPVEIGLKVGLEIHQQLSTRAKLFCACPVTKSGELPHSFERMLRPAQSELGHLDPAAVFEFARAKANVYSWSPESSCLVEADEEPPHPLNEEAVDIVLLVAQLLHSNTVDEIHIMRKIVIDGSNTGGFQRTGVIALGGNLSVDGRKVGVQTVTLEEDAARILGEDARARHFALDRLGIPLVEIALDPVTCRPEEVERIALNLGRALRSTGRVARGLGTIRQDLNISVGGGKVVEVKGVQKLSLLGKVVAYETARQMGMATIADELKKRGITEIKCKVADVSSMVEGSGSRILQKQIKQGGKATCISCGGISGLLGLEPFPGIRLGKELAEVARAGSLGGIIHSDEFRKQGIETKEEEALRRALGAARKDGLIIVAGEPAKVDAVIPLLISRLEQTVQGVPAETRAATDDGETKYMRPRPGAQRMYPETDIPEIVVTAERKAMLYRLLPEPWEENVRRLQEEHSLSPELALKLYDSEYLELFGELVGQLKLEPSLVASVLVDLPVRLAREGLGDGAIYDELLVETLRAIDAGKVAKEAAPDIVRLVGSGQAKDVIAAIEMLGLEPMSQHELGSLIDEVIREESKLIASKREDAFSPLMGQVMERARGRADGRLVSRLVREKLSAILKGN